MANINLEEARNFYYTKDTNAAIKAFQKYYQNGNLPERVESAYFLGKIACIKKENPEIINNYFNFAIANGNNFYIGRSYTELGIYNRFHKNYSKMIFYYKMALKYIPNDIKLLTEMANYFLNQNTLESSILATQYFQKILETNATQINEFKYNRNQNIAILGITKALIKQEKFSDAKEMLMRVKPQNQKDREEINKCYANIAFLEGNYGVSLKFLQENLKSNNSKVAIASREKIGIIYSIIGDFDKAIAALETVAAASSSDKNGYANYVLGYIYYLKKEYLKSYNANMLASKTFDGSIIYALRALMHIEEEKAVDLGNVINDSKHLHDYRPQLLYLSKKFNIFFPNLSYENLSNREEEIIAPDIFRIYARAVYNYNSDFDENLEIYTLYEENIEEKINDMLPVVKGSYYDTYLLKTLDQEKLKNAYLTITTLKDTKDIIEIRIITPEQMNKFTAKKTSNFQLHLVKSLFK